MNNLCGKLKCAEYAPPVMLIAETGKGRFLMESRTYYYARVSSREQNLDRQFAAFAALGAQERDIIADKESGKSINRSGYTALKSALLRRGDTLVIKSLDRLSRNKEDTKRELQYFRENGIRLKVLDLPTTMIEYLYTAEIEKSDILAVFSPETEREVLQYESAKNIREITEDELGEVCKQCDDYQRLKDCIAGVSELIKLPDSIAQMNSLLKNLKDKIHIKIKET